MEFHRNVKAYHARTRSAWQRWLQTNHKKEKSVWLIYYRKNSHVPCVDYNEAVEEALCFGWIDSTANPRDSKSSYRYFAQRKAKSEWSAINRERATRLIKEGLMMPAGQVMINLAKRTGKWKALDSVDKLIIPPDLQKQFDKSKKAFKNFSAFPPSSRKIILGWILRAVRPETRKQRIRDVVMLAARNIRANHYRKPEIANRKS